MDLLAKLNKSLKFGQAGAPRASLIHSNESSILAAATQLLSKSPTGNDLLEWARGNGVKLHVLRNKSNFGYMPDESTVYIACPAGQDMPAPRAVIDLAGAIRQAQQESSAELKRPKSALMPQADYVRIYVDRDRDMLFVQTAVVYELGMVNGLLEMIDEFDAMGYRSLYDAYKEDVKSQG